jgi:Cellulose biosynthesis protein BcsS
MRRTLCRWLLAAALGSGGAGARAADWYTGATPPVPDESWIVAVDASVSITSNSSQFAGVSGTMALTDNLRESGARARVEALAGAYDYKIKDTGQIVRGTQIEGGALVGYEWIWRNAALAGYIGLNVRDNQLSAYDPDNSVVGTAAGLKMVAEAYANPTDNTMVSAYGSYSTAHHAYYGRVKAGFALFGQTFVGPEVTFLGDDFFNQWRAGLHLTGLQVGMLKLGVAAGYVQDRVQKSGFYTSLDVRAAF